MKKFDPSPDIKNMIPALDLSPFTTREVDIIACLIHRRSSKKIGALLSLSSKTVSNHICNIMSKIGCSSREGILDYVEGAGYIPLLRQHYAHLNPTTFTEVQEIEKVFSRSLSPLTKKGKIFLGIGVGAFLLLTGGGVFFSLQLSPIKSKEFIARSDLILPSKSITLNRPEFIDKIDEKLKGKEGIQTVALAGIGGIGKTTLARQYAQRQQASIVWEINAETKESLRFSFEALAQMLVRTEEDQREIRAAQEIKDLEERDRKIILFVKNHLRIYPNWFLIYDNVEKFSDLQKYFPYDPNNWGNGKVLITTRNSNIQNDNHIIHMIQIDTLNSKQKFELFSKIMVIDSEHLNNEKKQELQKFLEEIPPFPLDISVAAYYLKATNISYKKYLSYINKYKKEFEITHEKIVKEASEYSKTRYNIITTSLQDLLNVHKDFSDFLLLISLIDSQHIPRELLVKYKNDILVDNFIYHLKKYSLITSEKLDPLVGQTFSLHRSTQTIILAHLTKLLNLEKDKHFISLITWNLKGSLEKAAEEENLFKIRLLKGHYESFLKHSDLLTSLIKESLKDDLGILYYHLSDYVKAKKIFEQRLIFLRKNNGNSVEMAQVLLHLGVTYRELGDFKKGKDLIEKSLKVYDEYFPEDSIGRAWILVHLGNIYRELNDYKKAKDLLEESFETYKKHLPKNQVRMAWILTYLGALNRDQGHYETAKKSLEQAFRLFKKNFSENHIRTAWTAILLARVYRELGDYKKAIDLSEQYVNVYKKSFGEDHVGISWVLVDLGVSYKELGDYQKAKYFLEKGIGIYKKHLSEDHLDLVKAQVKLGNVYIALGAYKKGRDLFERSLKIYESIYSQNHLERARVLNGLGQSYLLQGYLDISEKHFDKALDLFQKINHPESYLALENLAEVSLKRANKTRDAQQSKNSIAQAIDHLQRALKTVKICFLENSPHISRIQTKLKNLELASSNKLNKPYKEE